jgi:hypothetical protein
MYVLFMWRTSLEPYTYIHVRHFCRVDENGLEDPTHAHGCVPRYTHMYKNKHTYTSRVQCERDTSNGWQYSAWVHTYLYACVWDASNQTGLCSACIFAYMHTLIHGLTHTYTYIHAHARTYSVDEVPQTDDLARAILGIVEYELL